MSQTAAKPPYARRPAPPNTLKRYLDLEFANVQRGMLVQNVRTVFADTTVQATDDTIAADATGGAITVTLPTPDQLLYGRVSVKRLNSGANAVTLSGTIDGGSSYVLSAQWKSVTVQSDGVRWLILGTF